MYSRGLLSCEAVRYVCCRHRRRRTRLSPYRPHLHHDVTPTMPPPIAAATASATGGPHSPALTVPVSEARTNDGAGNGCSGGGVDGCGAPAAVPTALTPADVAALLSRPRLGKPVDAAPAGADGSRAAAAVASSSGPEPPPPPEAATPPSRWFVEPLTPDNLFVHRVASVFATVTTPFQQLAVVDTGTFGRALVLDGKIQTATGDEAFYHEPLVHIPAVLHATRPSASVADGGCSRSSSGDGSDGGPLGGLLAAAPTSALVLGGGDGGSVRELLRWPSMTAVTLVDIDGAVVDACRTHLRAIHGGALDGDPRVNVVVGDAVSFVADRRDTYDLILCDVTDPLEDGPSAALFTREFFAAVGRLLAEGGVMAIQAGPSSLVENPRLHPRVMRTLAAVFPHVASFVSYIPTYGSPLGMLRVEGGGSLRGREMASVVRSVMWYGLRGRVGGTSPSWLGSMAVAVAAPGGRGAHKIADSACALVWLMSVLLFFCTVDLAACIHPSRLPHAILLPLNSTCSLSPVPPRPALGPL